MVEITTEDILNALRGNKQPPAMPMFEAANQALQPLGQGIKNTVSDIYGRMQQAVTQGPGSSKSEYDPSIGMLAPELMLPAFGRASGLGAAGGGIKSGGVKTNWTPEMQARLKAIDESYPKGVMNRQKTIAKEFREIYPEFGASDGTIQNMTSRMRNWGGINKEGGVASVVPDPSEITSAQILEAMKKQNGPK